MARSIGIVDRMRWMTSLAAATLLAIAVSLTIRAQLNVTSTPGAGSTSVAAPAAPAGSTAPLDPRVASLAERHPGRAIEAIVQFKPGVSISQARADAASASARVIGQLHIIHALAVKLTAASARQLAASGDVRSLSLNSAIKPQDLTGGQLDSIAGSTANALSVSGGRLQTTFPQTLNMLTPWRYGVTGGGVGVAVVDTGIAGDLPDFSTSSGGGSRVVETAVTNPLAQNAGDSYGHGTDVAGIIAGNGNNRSSSDPLDGQYVGVAPNANLISIKASDENGNATVLDVIYGLQFAVDHQSDYNIRVVNLSLDSTTPQSYKTDPLDAAAEAAWFHGIVVVAAAGNRGNASDAVQYAPANDPYVITVGAVDEQGTPSTSDDTIPGWSSVGTTQDGFDKPDVYAPGAHIVSVLAPNSAFASMCGSCIVGGQYIRTGGTSMAAPMISGLVADLLQVRPGLTPDQVKGLLTSPNVSSNSSIQEPNALRVGTMYPAPTANQGLTPNALLGPGGNIDYSRSSWSRSSWSAANGSLNAGFARSSWSCDCSTTSGGGVDPSRSSWSRSSWSTHFDQQ